MSQPQKKVEEGRVEIFAAGIEGLENLFTQSIRAKLGDDADALKGFEIAEYQPRTKEQAAAIARMNKRFLTVKVLLGLDDAQDKWRIASFEMEEGLSHKVDKEIANALAFRCYQCVARMKRERKNRAIVA